MNKNSNIIIILLLILIALAGYIAFKKQKESTYVPVVENTPSENTNTNNNTNSNSNTNQNPNLIQKTAWGVSFEKPTGWDVTVNTNNQVVLTSGGSEGDRMTIDYVSGSSITTTDAKFGNVTFFYDEATQRWMKTGEDAATGQMVTTVAVADTSVGGPFHFVGTGRWATYVVPLSHTTFLKLNITGSGYTQGLKDLMGTLTVN